MIIAVIPARGGSKRIPRKNIKPFAGEPIISYSIKVALESNIFDRIIVSTDDEEIASVSLNYGAEVPFLRPKELADDYTGTIDVIKHAIIEHETSGVKADYICCIYATAPFLKKKYLIDGYEKLIKSDKKYAFSITTFPFPIQRAIKINDIEEIEPFYPEYVKARSQDLEEAYHDAGQFYWGKRDAFLQEIPLFSNNSIPVILPRYLVQDIDTMEDWIKAELMFKAMEPDFFL